MLKLLLPSAMIAPVFMLAFAGPQAGAGVLPTPATQPVATESCRSATLGVAFHDAWLESHSAERLAEAVLAAPGCELGFLRLTSLVAEDAGADELALAETRRGELAAHIVALIGEEAATALPVHADTRTISGHPDGRLNVRGHALVRLEMRPADPMLRLAEAEVTGSAPGDILRD